MANNGSWYATYELLGLAQEYESYRRSNGYRTAESEELIIQGITPNRIVKAFDTLKVPVWPYASDLNAAVAFNLRDVTKGSYNLQLHDGLPAHSPGFTLVEKLLVTLHNFREKCDYRYDLRTRFCFGSRYLSGFVPEVWWNEWSSPPVLCILWADEQLAKRIHFGPAAEPGYVHEGGE